METIKKYLKYILLAAVLAGGAFTAGRYSKPDKVVKDTIEVRVKDEEYTRQMVAQARAQWTKDSHSTTTTTSVVVKPCPPPTNDPYSCKPPCATDCTKCPSQTISSTTTTTTDTHATGSSTTTVVEKEKDVKHETDTKHTTTTTTNNEGDYRNWRLSLVASSILFDGSKLSFAPTYGASVGYKLLGPLNLSAAIYTDKKTTASLGLDLGKNWSVSADAGSKFDRFSLFYGGTMSRRILGPIWLSAWGTSEKVFGLSASFSVR